MKNSNKDTQGPSTITVAVIDDDSEFRESLVGWLQEAQGLACVGSFANTECATVQLAQNPPNVVLVDINLPGLSGIECVRELKPRIPNTQFVMITVYYDSDYIFDALMAGASGYLIKVSLQETLIKSIVDVHNGGSPMSSNVARKVIQLLRRSGTKIEPSEMLSKRENEVLALLAKGYKYKEVASSLGIGYQTVNTHARHIYKKLQVQSRGGAVARMAGFVGFEHELAE